MDSEKYELQQSLLKKGSYLGYRHVFSFLGFLGFLNVYAMRVNLSVAIVAMVNSTNNPGITNTTNNTDETCPAPDVPSNSTIIAPGSVLSPPRIIGHSGEFSGEFLLRRIFSPIFFRRNFNQKQLACKLSCGV